MRKTTVLLALASVFAIGGCGGPGKNAEVPQAEPAGETFKDIGDYVVHFSALSTDQVPPEIAKTYGITRSKNRAMLNVSVVRETDNQSVPATVNVKTTNLTQQLKNISMRRIDEQDAIYYIGETTVANRETLIFDIAVQPDGSASTANVRFTRQFYTD